ncbi:formate dehydrogenase accessory sulfurtransferase FdhD [Lentibacillus cibarius]|uniref:Sulfur carrier protein FdhD n=1 Tax=Lentibacillus cibarius TaxID=2583219 RepID=A0A5S3QN62_9BACI|nr:formate dehydrogenase accessory sulfurtransferase FdhD [Lentibacillus cibarius]TMN23384.1 formate dehydrogenase accessory sulfurtransferase FdhD [Lentibacillus cibarius]
MGNTKDYAWEVVQFHGTESAVMDDEIASEWPLTVMLNGDEFATMVCSPTDLDDLLIGFLAAEGMIRSYDEVISISVDEYKGFAYITVRNELETMHQDHSKRFIGSCCGKSRQFYLKNDAKTAKTVYSSISISVEQCYVLMEELQCQSEQFMRTGGVHNAALAEPDGVFTVRTDIGRHNALDKIYGHMLRNRIPVKNKLIVFSGRLSSEVVLKIAKIGAGIILSKSAPTDLALRLANDLRLTVIGFARGSKMNVYTHPHRIVEAQKNN